MRTVASILVGLVAVSCVPVRERRPPDAREVVFIPAAPRAQPAVVLDEAELRVAVEHLLADVNVRAAQSELRRLVADPRFHGRRLEELRVVLASWGSGPVALEEITRGYRAWCTQARRAGCIAGPLAESDVYGVAFDLAMGAEWDGFVGEVKSTIDPATIRVVLLTGLVIFMATIALPELTSKIPAAIATMVLTAYLGARAVCDLVFGWIRMVKELDAATTFDQVRAAGERYGRVVGAQTARILIMLATAAIAESGVIARLMKLPKAGQASAALEAETGGKLSLEAAGEAHEARVLQGGVSITVEGVAQGAVGIAMAAHGSSSEGTAARPSPTRFARRTVRLTRAEARQLAEQLGFKEVKDPPFDSHGEPVFRQGNRFIAADRDGHSGGTWKLFDQKGTRIGTYNDDLSVRIGD